LQTNVVAAVRGEVAAAAAAHTEIAAAAAFVAGPRIPIAAGAVAARILLGGRVLALGR